MMKKNSLSWQYDITSDWMQLTHGPLALPALVETREHLRLREMATNSDKRQNKTTETRNTVILGFKLDFSSSDFLGKYR